MCRNGNALTLLVPNKLSPLYAGFFRLSSFLFFKLSVYTESVSDVFAFVKHFYASSLGRSVTSNVTKIVSLLYHTCPQTRMDPTLLHVTFF